MARWLFRGRVAVLSLLLCLVVLVGCQVIFGNPEIGEPPENPGGPAGCQPGEFRCNQEYLLSCSGAETGWALASTCATAERCDDRNKTCTVCSPGDLRCNGAARERCSADGRNWEHVATCDGAELCSPHACGPCTPGDFQCEGANSNVLRECQPDRTWQEVAACASASLCMTTLEKARHDPTWPGTCDAPGCDAPGQYKCDGSTLLRCREDQTRWMQVHVCATEALCQRTSDNANTNGGGATVDRCASGCPVAGAFFCNGMTLQRCLEDMTDWETVKSCSAGTDCNPIQGDCTEPCTPGQYQCNGAQLRRCRGNRSWEVVNTCATAALCTPQANGCQPPACPTAGMNKCEQGQLFECSTDLTAWVPQLQCASAQLCNAQSKRCNEPVCASAGELRCFGQELKRCSDGLDQWLSVEVCDAGEYCDNTPSNPGCKTECTSSKRCNGHLLETCTRDQGWESDTKACASAELCNCGLNSTCPTQPDGCGRPVCEEGRYQCSGSTLQRCPRGRHTWDEAARCGSADLCYAGNPATNTAGYCAVCPVAGELRCSGTDPGSTLRVCSPDRRSWQTVQTCTSYSCVDSGTSDYCAICNLGDAQCDGSTLQRCAPDRRSWTLEQCDSAALCDAPGKQCDVCQAGTAWCTGATLNVCSADGQTQTPSNCLTAPLCDDQNKSCTPPTCQPEQRRCTDTGQPQVCNNALTAYVNDGMRCSTADHCWNGRCTACLAMEKRCMGRQPQTCNAMRTGFEDTGMPCATADLCMNGTCAAPACPAAGMRRCMGAQPQTCNAGQTAWENDGMPCTTADLCNPAQTGPRCQMAACEAGAARCMGQYLEVCNAGQTGYTRTDCLTEALCNVTMKRCDPPACAANAVECGGPSMTTLRQCNADQTAWTETPCTGTTPVCNATAGRCDECAVGASMCSTDNTAVRTCNSMGRWVETPCAAMEVCSAGTSGAMCGPAPPMP